MSWLTFNQTPSEYMYSAAASFSVWWKAHVNTVWNLGFHKREFLSHYQLLKVSIAIQNHNRKEFLEQLSHYQLLMDYGPWRNGVTKNHKKHCTAAIDSWFAHFLLHTSQPSPMCCSGAVSSQPIKQVDIVEQTKTIIVCCICRRRIPEVNVALCHLISTLTTEHNCCVCILLDEFWYQIHSCR